MRLLHSSVLLFSYKGYDASSNDRKLKSDSVASCSISPTLHLKRQTYSNNLAISFILHLRIIQHMETWLMKKQCGNSTPRFLWMFNSDTNEAAPDYIVEITTCFALDFYFYNIWSAILSYIVFVGGGQGRYN